MLRLWSTAARAALALGFWGLGVRAEPAAAAPAVGEPVRSDAAPSDAQKTDERAAPERVSPEPSDGGGHTLDAKKTNERVEAAKLTPIVASPNDASKTAFQLYGEVDLPILTTSAILASARLFRTDPPVCPKVDGHCDPATLNAIDRGFAGKWRPGWSTYSDVGLYSLAAGAATLLVIDEGVLPALNDMVVVAEAAFVATALPSMTTLATSRPRPFTYGNKAPLADRTSGGAALSFISSHTSISFAIASSMFVAERRLHPKSALPWVVLGVGLATATSVGTARVLAGQHFPTDVIAGAAIGASVGIVVASVHRLPIEVTPMKQGAQISFAGIF
ncbi:MAG TPA: phosphatase PAP2 family protein [Polyangiaceae bacterium]